MPCLPASATQILGDVEFRDLHFAYPAEAAIPSKCCTVFRSGFPPAPVLPSSAQPAPANRRWSASFPRLCDAPPGAVLIDGRAIRDYPLDALRAAVGFVPQETFLFSTTIHDNIAFGVPGASASEVARAAEVAHIREEFDLFPNGRDTTVGERGLTLSGGQKQRTALARAILRNPRILILDDALASVDTYTEERILEELRGVMAGRTTILISHRISTVRHADRIAVLVRGRIAELGTHEQLLARTAIMPASSRNSFSKKSSPSPTEIPASTRSSSSRPAPAPGPAFPPTSSSAPAARPHRPSIRRTSGSCAATFHASRTSRMQPIASRNRSADSSLDPSRHNAKIAV